MLILPFSSVTDHPFSNLLLEQHRCEEVKGWSVLDTFTLGAMRVRGPWTTLQSLHDWWKVSSRDKCSGPGPTRATAREGWHDPRLQCCMYYHARRRLAILTLIFQFYVVGEHLHLTDYTSTIATTHYVSEEIDFPSVSLSTDRVPCRAITQVLRSASSVVLCKFICVRFPIGPDSELLTIWMFCLE